jgi:CTP-dependent riboflavin kinase
LPPLGWYGVLWPLYSAPERRLRMNELAQEAVLSRTGLVRLIDRIEAAGLVRREPVPEDRRGAYATITEAEIETLGGCGRSTPAPGARARRGVVEGRSLSNCSSGSNSAGS